MEKPENILDEVDKFSPQASVIGAILIEPELMGLAASQLTPEDFTARNCRIAWQAMLSLFREGRTIDPVLLKDRLTGFANAAEFVVTCMDWSPTTASFRDHIATLKRQAMFSRLQDLGSDLMNASTLDEALALVAKANQCSMERQPREARTMADMMRSFYARHTGPVETYLPWPIKELNDGLHLRDGKYAIIAGRPSDGKTAFAGEAAIHQAKIGKRVVFYSLEMVIDDLEDRIEASLAKIDMSHMWRNEITQDEWTQYVEAAAYAEIPLTVVNASRMTVDDIQADALSRRAEVVYIDYLQLVEPERASKGWNRQEEVAAISRRLVQFSKSTGVTVIALSQLSRPVKDGKSQKAPPSMSDLRESGQIEQDADVVLTIWREDRQNIRAPRFLDVLKNRQGRTGRFSLEFDGAHQHFAISRPAASLPDLKKPTHRTPVLADDNQGQYEQLPLSTAVPFENKQEA